MEPVRFTVKKVKRASTNVQAILPVRFAPPGKNGRMPRKLFSRMNRKAMHK